MFFNDLFWHGFQREALITRHDDPKRTPRLSGVRYRKRQSDERRLLDEQEEYWQAFQLLDQVVSEAGPGPTGLKAARKALDCLSRISQDRFRREDEIEAAKKRLFGWIRTAQKKSG